MEDSSRPARKTDRRTLYTRTVIKDALLEAMRTRHFEEVTVTQVCRLAEITRATYYLHYSSLTEVLDEVLKDALRMAEDQGSMDQMDFERVAQAMDSGDAARMQENFALLPVCHRVAELPKYAVVFRDETISNYVVNQIYQSQKKRLVAYFSQKLHLGEKEAQMLAWFTISGTYSVNKALGWNKDENWYHIHAMLLRFFSGGLDRLQQGREDTRKPRK